MFIINFGIDVLSWDDEEGVFSVSYGISGINKIINVVVGEIVSDSIDIVNGFQFYEINMLIFQYNEFIS